MKKKGENVGFKMRKSDSGVFGRKKNTGAQIINVRTFIV